jgi:hypothetical protein
MLVSAIDIVSNLGWVGAVLGIIFFLGLILAVVWLTGAASAALHSIAVIKTVHTVVFFLLSALLLAFVYEVITNQMTFLTWTAVTLFLAEGVVLLLNHGRCPLTTYAEKLGSSHGQITDTFLPKWFADQVFRVYGGLFAGTLVLLAVRLIVR